MKKNKLLLIAFGIFFSINLNAQNDFKIGINAGLNYPDIRGHEYARYRNFTAGFLVGFSFDSYLNDHFSLKANINYERKNNKRQLTYYNYDAEETGTEDFKQEFDYINLPVLLKYEFWNSNLFVNGGPFFNYLLNNKIKPDFPHDDSDNVTEQKKYDLGLSFGIGANISLNERNDLTIEIRDDLGMINTGGVPKHLGGGTVKTNVIKAILSWNLGI